MPSRPSVPGASSHCALHTPTRTSVNIKRNFVLDLIWVAHSDAAVCVRKCPLSTHKLITIVAERGICIHVEPFSLSLKKKSIHFRANHSGGIVYFFLIRALRAFAGRRDAESWAKFVVACVIVRAGHGAWGLGHEAWGMGHAGAVPRSPRAAAPPRRVSARFKNYTNEPAQRAP